MPRSADFGLDRGHAWVVLLASFLSCLTIGGNIYGVGLIHAALLERYQQDVTKTAWAGALNYALASGGAPMSSLLVDRFSCRVAIMMSGVFYTLAYLTTAFAPTLEVAVFTCGILAGFGGAIGYMASIVVIGFNFRRRRNVAMGISVSGIGLGLFMLAPVIQVAKDYYGIGGFFIILAGLMSQLMVFGALCRPSELELETKRMRNADSVQNSGTKRKRFASFNHYLNICRNKAVVCLCLNMFSYYLGTQLLFLHLPSYAVSQGFSHMQTSMFMSIVGVLTVAGRILTGFVANTHIVNDIVIYAGTMGILCIATFLFPLYSSSFAGQVVFSVILGTFFGSCYVVIGSINIQFVGVEYMSFAIGLEFFFAGIGAVTGPLLSGGTYQQTLLVSAACMLLATVLGFATQLVGHRLPAESSPQAADVQLEVTRAREGAGLELLEPAPVGNPLPDRPGERHSAEVTARLLQPTDLSNTSDEALE